MAAYIIEFGIISGYFLFYLDKVYCVYSLESPLWGDSTENTQHTFMLEKLKENPYYAFCHGAMINTY